jgi:hypothetical protein
MRLLHTPTAAKREWLHPLLFYWTVFFVPVFLLNEGADHRLALSLLQSLAAPLLIVALVLFGPWNRDRVFRAYYRKHFGAGPYATSIELGDDQLIHRFEEMETRFAWRAVRKLERVPDELRIFISTYALISIRTSDFASDEEMERWMRFLEQKTGLSFS